MTNQEFKEKALMPNRIFNVTENTYDYACPMCKIRINGRPSYHNYCSNCGQRLDWKPKLNMNDFSELNKKPERKPKFEVGQKVIISNPTHPQYHKLGSVFTVEKIQENDLEGGAKYTYFFVGDPNGFGCHEEELDFIRSGQ